MRLKPRNDVCVTFDLAEVPGGNIAAWGRECCAQALAGIELGDWRPVHDWTKSWVGWGGGAWLPDTWILHAVSGLLQRTPRLAVHGLDLGLRVWLTGAADRAALTWLRGVVVMDRLHDPKSALLDLRAGRELLPAWVSGSPDVRLAECGAAAEVSRKRVSSVKPRPGYVGPESMAHGVAPPIDSRSDGDEPFIWKAVARYLE